MTVLHNAIPTLPLLQRRQMLFQSGIGLGGLALASMLGQTQEVNAAPHFAPRAKRIISLFMHGGPSQLDLLDGKPGLAQLRGQELPASVRGNQRLTGMTSKQSSLPVTPSIFQFQQYGDNGTWISDLLPCTGSIVNDLCIVRSMFTEAINHDPAVTLLQTGHQQPGRPSFGAWLSYGLGAANENLPAFVVLLSHGSAARPADPLYARLWGSGFLPSNHQGVALRSQGDPVLYLSNPQGIDPATRRDQLNVVAALNQQQFAQLQDPEIATRITQYELGFRLQSSVPELTDMSGETDQTLAAYGPEVTQPGTFSANCLLARKMAEHGVRFIQLYHRGWDQHYNLPSDLRLQCRDVDQPAAALVRDLKQRGLLDETLVIWGGEFGRTTYSQGKLEPENYGRDHHGGCFTIWLAGGGIKPGTVYGETDDFCYNVVRDPVHVHDLNATLLHQLGLNHEKLTYRSQGRDYRLTDVHGRVVQEILT